jgi:BMFP domain-containing protein YqiC
MADFIDRAILIVMGLEKKTKELLEELAEAGKKEAGEGEEGLEPGKVAKNRLVDEGTKVTKDLLELLKECKEKLGKSCTEAAESLVEKLHMATKNELETVKEMARVAREKVDKLEKKLKELEKTEKKKS